MSTNTSTPASSTPAQTSTTSSATTYKLRHKVPSLSDDGSDYGQWSYCTHLILESHELWDVVDGTSARPDSITDPAAYQVWAQKDHDA